MGYHIWRRMPDPPYQRFACTIVPDSKATDGYKITDIDPHVADMRFLHTLAQHMLREAPVRGAYRDGGVIVETMKMSANGQHGHFEAAIRLIPNAYLSAVGRQT